jgi:hypothetical protein
VESHPLRRDVATGKSAAHSDIPQSTPHLKASMTEERKYAILFAATLLSARRPIENIASSKPKLNEQYFVDEAIKKAAFVLKRIDKAFPSDR